MERTLRDVWDFDYKTADVCRAANKQKAHHGARFAWWKKESEAAEKRLKDKGFEYREEQYSGRADVVIVGDPQLVKRVTDCKRMMEDHHEQEELYGTWARALAGKVEQEPDSQLVLKLDDVVFFGL